MLQPVDDKKEARQAVLSRFGVQGAAAPVQAAGAAAPAGDRASVLSRFGVQQKAETVQPEAGNVQLEAGNVQPEPTSVQAPEQQRARFPAPELPAPDMAARPSSTGVAVTLPGQERKPGAPLIEDVETLANAIPRGALNAAASMVRGLDLMEDLDDPVARQQRVEASLRGETVPSKIANLIQLFALKEFPGDAEARQTFINQTLEGLGSIAPFVAARLTPAGIPGIVAAGIASGEGQLLDEARIADADASDIVTDRSQVATILGGAVEAVPIERALGRLVPKAMKGRIVDVLLGAGEEGLQEGIQQIAQNYAVQSFDEQREILDGIKEAASVGGATGALLNVIIGVLGGRGVRMPGATTEQTDEQSTAVGPEIVPTEPPTPNGDAAGTEEERLRLQGAEREDPAGSQPPLEAEAEAVAPDAAQQTEPTAPDTTPAAGPESGREQPQGREDQGREADEAGGLAQSAETEPFRSSTGNTVRRLSDGRIEVTSDRTGKPVDRRSKRYEPAVVEFMGAKLDELDAAPRLSVSPDVSLDEYAADVASVSTNPFEILEAFEVVRTRGQSETNPVEEWLLSPVAGRFKTDSFDRFGDPNMRRDSSIAANWLAKDGKSIDAVAQEITSTTGIQTTPQDIINYIASNPGRTANKETQITRHLRERFEEVTGVRLTDSIAASIFDRLYESAQVEPEIIAPFEPTVPYRGRQPETGEQTPQAGARRAEAEAVDASPAQGRRDPVSKGRRSDLAKELDTPVKPADLTYELREGEPKRIRRLAAQALNDLRRVVREAIRSGGQIDLFATQRDLFEQASDRPRGETGGRIPAESALPDTSRFEGQGAHLLALGITEDIQDSPVRLIGQTVRTAADLAAIAQVYRDPRYETLRAFFVRGNVIVGQTGITSRLPGTARAFSNEAIRAGEEAKRGGASNEAANKIRLREFRDLMKGYDADGYYLLHNHPSGEVDPSAEDQTATRAYMYGAPGFLGHVIIDSGKYSVLRRQAGVWPDLRTEHREIMDPAVLKRGRIDPVSGTDELLSPSRPHYFLGEKLFDPDGIAQIMLRLKKEGVRGYVLVGFDSQARVRMIMDVPAGFFDMLLAGEMSLDEAVNTIRDYGRNSGSRYLALAGLPTARDINDLARLFYKGIFVDMVAMDGSSAYAIGLTHERGRNPSDLGFTVEELPNIRVAEDAKEFRSGGTPQAVRRTIGKQLRKGPQRPDVSAQDAGEVTAADVGPAAAAILSAPDVQASMATRSIDVALTDQALNSGRPISAPDVIESLVAVVKAAGGITPVRTGHMGKHARRALGIFKVQPEVIRLRTADDIPVATHEVGHALEKAVYGWVSGTPFTGKNGLTRAMQKELEDLGHALYGSTKPAGGYKREGWAEFISYYVLTNEAPNVAPQLHAWFENRFLKENPTVAEALAKAKEDASTWFQQGAVKRAKASVAGKEPLFARMKASLKSERLERLRQVAARLFVTEFQPIKTVTEEAERLKGRALPIHKNPFLTAEALGKTHAARVERMVEDGMMDFTGTVTGPSLRQAAAIVKHKREEFTAYLWARRALKLWAGQREIKDADGNVVQPFKAPRNPGLSKEDAQEIFDTYDSREFRLAASMVHEWNQGVLNYASIAFGPDFADKIKAGDVGDYIPLQRVFDDLEDMGMRAARRRGSGQVKGRDPVKKLKGSGRRIRDPFEAMIEQATTMVRATHERYIINQLVALRGIEGMGAYIEEVPRDQLPFTVSIDRISDTLDKMGFAVEQIDDVASSVAVFFSPAYAPKGQDPIIAAEVGGEIKWFQVDEELYKALAGLDIFRLPWYLDAVLGAPTRLFRLGTTGLRAAFSLVTNPLRDIQTLYAQSLSSANPGTMAAAYFRALYAGLRYEITDNIDADPHFAAFYRLGGEIAQPLGQDINATRRAVRELFQDRKVRIIDPRNWIDLLRDLFQIPESAARTAEIRLMAKEAGWTPGTPMNEQQALSLLLAAKRVTVDFSSQGQLAKVFNQMIPFVTSNIGGQRAFVRSFKTNPKRAIMYGASMVAMTLAYWWQHKDEEWYKDLLPRERFGYWYFVIGEDGPVIMIPRAFEWGGFFSVLPEALMDAWYRADPETVGEGFGHLYKNMNPLDIPQTLAPMAEQLANQDFYSDRPIVPRGEEFKPVEEQVGPYTTAVAIVLGDVFGASPRRIDHLIRGYTGGAGADAAQAMDGLLAALGVEVPERPTREREASDLPVAGRLFRRGGKEGTQSKAIDRFYDRLAEAQVKQQSDRNPEAEDDRMIRLMLGDAQDALQVIFFIRNNTPENEKREQLHVLARQVARTAIRTADEGPKAAADFRKQFEGIGSVNRKKKDYDFEEVRSFFEKSIEPKIAARTAAGDSPN